MKSHSILIFLFFTVLSFFTFCSCDAKNTDTIIAEEDEKTDITLEDFAIVTAVTISGNEGNYTFSVTLSSPDTGCEQYADWWEIIDTEGSLLYRRILAHSHVNEQPFTRAGGAVAIAKDKKIYVRAHMNNSSYGSKVMEGSVNDGFTNADLSIDFAKELENQEPLPNGCAF